MEFYRNPEASLPALELTFRDYLTALNSVENAAAFRDARQYWMQRAPSLPPAPDLPLSTNPAAISKPIFKRRTAKLDAEVWQKLKEQGGLHSATPSGLLLAAYAEILAMWSKNQRFTVNLALFNRLPLHPQANDIIGDFTSVSLLEIDNSDAAPFARRVLRQQQQLWRDLDHRHFSGIQVMRELRRLQGVGPKAIMPVVFTSLLNLDDQGEGTTWSYRIGKPAFTITQTPQVYLDFIVQEDKGSLILNWDAVDDLFADGMLDDMFESFQRLLSQLANSDASWDSSFADTARQLLPSGQLEIRNQVNATEAPISDELLHTPFLRQVAERPNELAICTPKRRLTYAEAYQRACYVERELLDRGVGPNQMVGVLMAKGWEQVVAVFGIHFAGAAYLPIDSELPVERQRYLMENSAVKVLLIQSELQSRLEVPQGIPVLAVDTMEPLESVPPVPRRRQKLEDLAYIIYTSGSTGLPKGVMIDHRGAMNTVLDINRRFSVGPRDRVLALSRLNFDLSVYDIFGLLAAGGAIVFPAPELAQDPSHWAELIVSEKVTLWNTVPALMQLMTEEASRKGGTGIGTTLRVVMMSGDWIPVNLPGQIQRVLPETEIISMGGATEASIWSIMYPIEKVDPNWKSVPYGKPMVNQTFHVLNQALSPSPVWVPGQLYIGGIGVARGYFGDEKKTNASFLRHPVTGERLYRTGDLGRYLPDGNIEFLGREDFQVKIQGYRIELGEIEARLQEYPGVDNCAVIVRQDNPGEKRLVGYAVPHEGVQLDTTAVREYLRAKLPEYMIPSAFVFLDRFPLTANGKVDRKALPAPARPKAGGGGSKSSAGDFLEAQLTHLWEKTLGVRPVGPNDNFFELGGTSMMAVRLFSELRQRFGKSLSLSTLFQAPTVAKIAGLLRSSGYAPSWASLVPIQPGGSKPTFYCVHGAGGNVLMFRELAERMAPDVP
jgi:pyochelin synthetase